MPPPTSQDDLESMLAIERGLGHGLRQLDAAAGKRGATGRRPSDRVVHTTLPCEAVDIDAGPQAPLLRATRFRGKAVEVDIDREACTVEVAVRPAHPVGGGWKRHGFDVELDLTAARFACEG